MSENGARVSKSFGSRQAERLRTEASELEATRRASRHSTAVW